MGAILNLDRRASRPVSQIVQRSLNRPITWEHHLNLPGTEPDKLPELSPLSPPSRLGSDRDDFDRHARFMAGCLAATTGAIPLLVTDQHFFSLPFYKALSDANPGEEMRILSLDNHLDGVDITYTNWAFWGFGLTEGIIKPENLTIVGSRQQVRAEAFADDHNCHQAITGFYYRTNDQYHEFIDQAAREVAAGNPALDPAEIKKDRRLRDFAEYALLKNSGVTMRQSLTGLDLSGQSLFVSFDTDVVMERERLLGIAAIIRRAKVLGIHVNELSQGIPLHGQETIETFVQAII